MLAGAATVYQNADMVCQVKEILPEEFSCIREDPVVLTCPDTTPSMESTAASITPWTTYHQLVRKPSPGCRPASLFICGAHRLQGGRVGS